MRLITSSVSVASSSDPLAASTGRACKATESVLLRGRDLNELLCPFAESTIRHIPARTRAISLVTVGGMPKAATPWGQTEVVEELTVPQRAGEKRFATIVQLLADAKGDELVRFAYSTGGTARRGPVTLRARDLERLRSALAEHPGLARALGLTNGRA